METRKFYDVHMHAFDLSHPNLFAFIDRMFNNVSHKLIFKGIFKLFKISPALLWAFIAVIFLVVFSGYIAALAHFISHCCKYNFHEIDFCFVLSALLSLAGVAVVIWIAYKVEKLKKVPNRMFNCLSVMENPLEYQFLMLEYFLKKENLLIIDNKLHIGKNEYDKIVLCPLMMDFGKKNIEKSDIFYNLVPKKPIIKQVVDLLNASKTYFDKILEEENEGVVWKDRKSIKKEEKKLFYEKLFDEKLFEIYPFIGLNTINYISTNNYKLEKMFEKYFNKYESDTKEDRRRKLNDNMGKFLGDIYDSSIDFTYYFAGIKVYPPLGFNPMPLQGNELKAVLYLYDTAQAKRIPIITHCSEGGFQTDKNAKEYTDPGKAWSKVLQNYKNLKLCFAHFGHQNKNRKEWQNTIIQLIEKYDHVYTDISCCKGDKKYYDDLYNLICKHPKLKSRILFGSDFSINLFTGETSYNSYLENFRKHFDNEFTDFICSKNSEEFLFGNVQFNT